MDENLIKKAATVMKIIKLAGTPGMDEVAIKLNREPTYDELRYAKMWAKAFELAKQNKNLFELAEELSKATRW